MSARRDGLGFFSRLPAGLAAAAACLLLGMGACAPGLGGGGAPGAGAPVRNPGEAGPAVAAGSASLFAYPWTWTDEQGAPAPFSRWRGQPLVVTAIFTQCKATCPRTLAKLRQVYERFRHEGHPAQFLLVTLDPANDTPQTLLRFKTESDLPGPWHLLSGTTDDTRELRDLLGIHVIDDGPHLLHDGRIVVFNERGMPMRTFAGWSLNEEAAL